MFKRATRTSPTSEREAINATQSVRSSGRTSRGLSISLEAVQALSDDCVEKRKEKDETRCCTQTGGERGQRNDARGCTRQRAPSDTRSMGDSVVFAWPE